MTNEPPFRKPTPRRTTVWPHDGASARTVTAPGTAPDAAFTPRRKRRALFSMPQPKRREDDARR